MLLIGKGIHTGRTCKVNLSWASSPGLWIKNPLSLEAYKVGGEIKPVFKAHRNTSVNIGAQKWETPEHALAALVPFANRGLLLETSGKELPGLDGSAWPWVELYARLVLQNSCTQTPKDSSIHHTVVSKGYGQTEISNTPESEIIKDLEPDYQLFNPPESIYEFQTTQIQIEPADRFEVRIAQQEVSEESCFEKLPQGEGQVKSTIPSSKSLIKNGEGFQYLHNTNSAKFLTFGYPAKAHLDSFTWLQIMSARTPCRWNDFWLGWKNGRLKGVHPGCGLGLYKNTLEAEQIKEYLGSQILANFKVSKYNEPAETFEEPLFWGAPRKFPYEEYAHKILDLLGDLAWLGPRLPQVRLVLNGAGHFQHHQLVERFYT